MRKLILLALVCLPAFPQGAQRISTALISSGSQIPYAQLVPRALITVCPYTSTLICNTPTVSLYQNVGLSVPLSNPFSADSSGSYNYYILSATVLEKVCAPNGACKTYVVTPGGGGSGGLTGANFALSNLALVSINTSLLFQSAVDIGSAVAPPKNIYLSGSSAQTAGSIEMTGTPTANRVWSFPDTSDIFAGLTNNQVFSGTNTFPNILANNVFSQAGVSSAAIGLPSTGTTITRNVPDVRPILTVQNLNASSTGDMVDFKNSAGTLVAFVDSTGALTVTGCTGCGGGGGSGTVTSVGLVMPAMFTVTGSPVTSSGVLTTTLSTQAGFTLFGVDSNSTTQPSFFNICNLADGTTITCANGLFSSATSGGTVTGISINSGSVATPTAGTVNLIVPTLVASGQGICFTGSTTLTGFACPGPRVVTGTTDTVTQVDCGGVIRYTNAGAIAIGLPQAGVSITGQCPVLFSVEGAGGATITPAVSTIAGLTSYVMNAGTRANPDILGILSDSGNWDVSYNSASSGGGSVSSVSLTAPSWLAVGGVPITSSGTIAITPASAQTSHRVIGTCGTATTFTPCALVTGDLPTSIPLTNLATQAATTFVANASGSSAIPTAITIANANTMLGTVPATSSTFGVVKCDGTSVICTAGVISTPAVGTVTSVAATVPPWLTVAGSPITSSGTLAISPTTAQTSHQVIGTCGSATTFTPCALVTGDLPTGIPLANIATIANSTILGNNSGSTGIPIALTLPNVNALLGTVPSTSTTFGVVKVDGTTITSSGGVITAVGGGGGASTPATNNSLLGNGSANGVVASKLYYVDSFPTSCTVAGTAYSTQLDCAFYTAVNSGVGPALHLGSNTFSTPYTTCAGLVEPATGLQISIVGEGAGDNHSPTQITASCSITAVISHAPISTGVSTPYSLYIKNINIDANGNASQCLYITAEKVGGIENVHCRNATSTSKAWIEIGDNAPGSGLQGGLYQYPITDVFISGTGNGSSSWATLTPSQSGGTPSITVNTTGTYVTSTPPVYLWGFGSAGTSGQPCTVMGTATAVMTGTGPFHLSSVTLSGYSGCGGTIYAEVPDLVAAAPYGFSEQGVTDSTFTDVVVNNVGRTAAIQWSGGSNTIIHEHPYSPSFYLVEENSNNTHYMAELDSGTVYGVDLKSGKSQWVNTEFVWAGSNPPVGAQGFFNETSSLQLTNSSCSGATVNSNGFNLLINSTTGPFGRTAAVNYGAGYQIMGGQECDTLNSVNWIPANLGGLNIVALNQLSTQVDSSTTPGVSIGSGSLTTNFLGVSGSRARFGYDGTGAFVQSSGGIKYYNSGSTTASGNIGGLTVNGIPFYNESSSIASATTIAPTIPIFHVTGTASIQTITAPSGCTTTGESCEITIIPDGAFQTVNTGNISLALTAVVGQVIKLMYDPSTSIWYPSPGATSVSAGVASVNGQTGVVNPNQGGVVSDFFHIAASMTLQNDYCFGSSCTSLTSNAIHNATDLGTYFVPYGIAGTTPINMEWERYQTFSASANFVFNTNSLALTATYQGGGLAAGNIFSGQIVSKANYEPNLTGFVSYAFDLRRKVVGACGSWPAFWFYTSNANGGGDASEIDDLEFFNENNPYTNQTNCTSGSGPGFYSSLTYTGNQHGPGAGSTIYNLKTIKTGADYWWPGIDFSADFHDFQVLWTPSTVCKYIDNQLISCDAFTWTSGQGSTTTTSATTASTTVHVTSTTPFNTAGSALFASWFQCSTCTTQVPVGTFVTAIGAGTVTLNNAVTIPSGATVNAFNPSQMIANFAYGTDNTSGFPGMQPVSTSQFPASDLIQYIKIWGSQADLSPTIATPRY